MLNRWRDSRESTGHAVSRPAHLDREFVKWLKEGCIRWLREGFAKWIKAGFVKWLKEIGVL